MKPIGDTAAVVITGLGLIAFLITVMAGRAGVL